MPAVGLRELSGRAQGAFTSIDAVLQCPCKYDPTIPATTRATVAAAFIPRLCQVHRCTTIACVLDVRCGAAIFTSQCTCMLM